ncbi:MAG: ATP synthase F1 subunit delta [Candidatus Buchananbacteria bacterium]|nr:ATP synthase F1 subunit delta [Candidatus Buchananbacteria bacterium]
MRISDKKYARALYEATEKISGVKRDAVVKKFVAVLARHHALSRIENIINEYQRYAIEQQGQLSVTATFAKKISKAENEKLITKLNKMLQRKVILETAIDSTLIGGSIIKYGDTVVDGSVKRAIADLKQSMVQIYAKK